MIAKLVTVSLMVRVIVDFDADDEMIWLKAKPKFVKNLDDAGMDNLEAIEDDEQCPYDPKTDVL